MCALLRRHRKSGLQDPEQVQCIIPGCMYVRKKWWPFGIKLLARSAGFVFAISPAGYCFLWKSCHLWCYFALRRYKEPPPPLQFSLKFHLREIFTSVFSSKTPIWSSDFYPWLLSTINFNSPRYFKFEVFPRMIRILGNNVFVKLEQNKW